MRLLTHIRIVHHHLQQHPVDADGVVHRLVDQLEPRQRVVTVHAFEAPVYAAIGQRSLRPVGVVVSRGSVQREVSRVQGVVADHLKELRFEPWLQFARMLGSGHQFSP
ncbi:hypothetical protein D9M70_550170 [compost metagenome]